MFVVTFNFCCSPQNGTSEKKMINDSIFKIETNLSAFGVESDNFPSIDGCIDFLHDSSGFIKSYYNPAFKGTTYSLSHIEIKRVMELLQNADLEKLKNEYKVGMSDQPTSTITIYTSKRKFIIKDYGLEGEYPLKELYKIVYKF